MRFGRSASPCHGGGFKCRKTIGTFRVSFHRRGSDRRRHKRCTFSSINARLRIRTSCALREAYRGFLPEKQYPSAFLFLEMPGTDVDINVHPTKREVRFKRDAQVCAFVAEAVRECLKNACRQPFGVTHDAPLPIENIFPVSGNTSFCACRDESFASELTANSQKSTENSEDMQNVSYASDAGASTLNTNVLRSDETVEKGKNNINFENGTTGGFEPTKSSDNSQSTSDDKEDIAHTLQDFSDKAGYGSPCPSEASEAEKNGANFYWNVTDTSPLPITSEHHADIWSSQNSSVETGYRLNTDGSQRTEAVADTNKPVHSGNNIHNFTPSQSFSTETVSESTSGNTKSTETSHDAFDIPFFALWQNRWAFFNNTSSLLVLDCKGAQLRLWYDRIASLLKQEQIGPLQTLLFPHIFSLEDRRAAFFSESLDWLKFSKICIARALNDTQFQLEALPQWVPSEQADLFIEQIAASLEYGGQMIALRYRFEPLLVRLAQRHRFEPVTNEKQVRALCRELQTCENYVTDPLGNHIWNQIYADDLMGKIRAYG